MTAALAAAPAVAWFVPVPVPSRVEVAVPARSPRRLALVGSPGPGAPRVRAAARRPPAPAAPPLRLTRRGAHVVALAVLALTLLGGVSRLEAAAPVGATSIAQLAPGTPLTSPGGLVLDVPKR